MCFVDIMTKMEGIYIWHSTRMTILLMFQYHLCHRRSSGSEWLVDFLNSDLGSGEASFGSFFIFT